MTNLHQNDENNKFIPESNNLSLNDFWRNTTKVLLESEFLKDNDGNIKSSQPGDLIFNALPISLKKCIDVFDDNNSKSVFLFGALGCLSAVMPNVSGIYFKLKVYSNLFVYVIGSAGSGKGWLTFSKRLVRLIHERIQVSDPEKSLFIAANTSSTKAITELENNDGVALFFETEGDTMANAFKMEGGNYSDLLRKGFHHEGISLSRKTDNLKVNIDVPRISAVLSSTYSQITSLMDNAENGLFSRFMFIETKSAGWLNPFTEEEENFDMEAFYNSMGEYYYDMYEYLKLQDPINFSWNKEQKGYFNTIFSKWHNDFRSHIKKTYGFGEEEFDGIVFRLGLICFRVAMVLTIIRNYDTRTIKPVLVCNDEDFFTALRIVEIAKINSIAVLNRLPKPHYLKSYESNKKVKEAKQFDLVIELYKQDLSFAKIAEKVFGDKLKKPQVQKLIEKYKSETV